MIAARCRPHERYLVHWTRPGSDLSLCGRRTRVSEPSGTLPTCSLCLHRAQASVGVIYLLHFDRPFGHARHYLGWTQNLSWRLSHHQAGTGANLLRHVAQAGISWRLVGLWAGDRNLERAMKNHGHGRRCFECRAFQEEFEPRVALGRTGELHPAPAILDQGTS